MILGTSERFMQENIRNVPAVRQATLIVQKFQPISSTGVLMTIPGVACT